MNNTRWNKNYEMDGEVLSVSQWAEKYGIKQGRLAERLRRGYDLKFSIFYPVTNQFDFREKYEAYKRGEPVW
jgi:hypothetical protein